MCYICPIQQFNRVRFTGNNFFTTVLSSLSCPGSWTLTTHTFQRLVLRSESLSGKCAKLHTVAASNNRDHMPWSLYYCLFAQGQRRRCNNIHIRDGTGR